MKVCVNILTRIAKVYGTGSSGFFLNVWTPGVFTAFCCPTVADGVLFLAAISVWFNLTGVVVDRFASKVVDRFLPTGVEMFNGSEVDRFALMVVDKSGVIVDDVFNGRVVD